MSTMLRWRVFQVVSVVTVQDEEDCRRVVVVGARTGRTAMMVPGSDRSWQASRLHLAVRGECGAYGWGVPSARYAMLDVFRGLKSLVKISHVHIDSPVFRLHYSLTVMLLSAFSLIVTTRQYVGNPIDCVHTKDIPEDVLNTYCWIHSTYTIKEAFKKKVGVAVPYPGVDNTRGKVDDRKTYGYYQWVCFCLFFQVYYQTRVMRVHSYDRYNGRFK